MNQSVSDTQDRYVQTEDKRPDPKPRKHPQLWQSFLWWNELVEQRKRHLLRISSIKAGKSNMDSVFEETMIEAISLDTHIDNLVKTMINSGSQLTIWPWITSIRGLKSGSLAAQLLGQIDDIERFETVSKLWRFCGFAVFDGRREYNIPGETSHYNRRLKATCFLIADQFIKQRTPYYSDIYYAEKDRLRELHPEIICRQCSNGTEALWSDCEQKKKHSRMYNDGHIHNMAWRKMIKTFLKDLWIEWRKVNHDCCDTQKVNVP